MHFVIKWFLSHQFSVQIQHIYWTVSSNVSQLASDFVIVGAWCWLKAVVLRNKAPFHSSYRLSGVIFHLVTGSVVWTAWLKANQFRNRTNEYDSLSSHLDTVSALLSLPLRGHRFNSHSSNCIPLSCPGARVSSSSLSLYLHQLHQVWALWLDWSNFPCRPDFI